jgi:xanthine dehydrogenase small subunit
MQTQPIRFYYHGRIHTVETADATRTVLNHLREDLHCTGTKEGCAEGDCGACTVVVGEPDGESGLKLRALNACIQLLPTLDGRSLFTVEDLQGADGALHPVQRALVDCHGSQCGFCTPGFAMSMWALYAGTDPAAGPPTRGEINDALSGNLCRCTGYRPIIDAAVAMFDHPRAQQPDTAAAAAALRTIARTGTLSLQYRDTFGEHMFYAPRTLDEFARLRLEQPQARILAGGTDIALWVTKQFRALGDILYIGNVAELAGIAEDAQTLTIGAAVSLEDAYRALAAVYPEMAELWSRFASLPVRNAGTLGGNLANGSPIGDSMPPLIALDARVVLRRGERERTLPLDAFYLGYQHNALEPGEFLAEVRVPKPAPDLRLRVYKLSKRRDQDISAVCAAFALHVRDDGTVAGARVAFGGMAATPRRAPATEAALLGQRWDADTAARAMDALDTDYTPLSDMRASAAYRSRAARALLHRYYLETRDDDPLRISEVNVFAASLSEARHEHS